MERESAMAVANKFIQMGLQRGTPLTQMKLQKMLFFAQGWYLAIYGEPLFEEDFEAWDYGPVIPSVYSEFRDFGMRGINRMGMTLTPCGGSFAISEPPLIREEALNSFFEKIWSVYGIYNGTQLSAMTHRADTPWSLVREPYGQFVPRSLCIPKSLIKSYFYTKANRNREENQVR